MNSFFAILFRQKYILRWGLMRNTTPESLSEHSSETAFVAHALAVIGNRVFGKAYDPDRVATLALFHDVPEVFTGDLPTPIKYFSSEMRSEYGKIEEQAVERLLTALPEEFREEYRAYLAPAEADAESLKLVKAADRLCAYIKCLIEETCGNREFENAKKATEKKLDALECEELAYFREHFLPAFTLTLDEM